MDDNIKTFLESKNKNVLSKSLNNEIILKKNICENEKYKLKERLKTKNQLEKKRQEPSQRLKDKIENHQLIIGDLEAEIENLTTCFLQSIDLTNIALSKLRKLDPEKAHEMEYSQSLKTHNARRNRL
ncbi:hypothetical protein [Vibrio porteresiae]|uniref:Uncharacterized protein n=1 Tax=Vibrio porteresiae DSM 19223 TaxID=1123496 RepID=A0ABZ0QCG1_9VIBR|nr:hypothetical protein [Vibrio porteresiae]WPC74154.1 hypothetical protein R8Z52_02465 [Vibrio porteresiae DSM 19223]WPC74647.1 hypothetical protein R8Z52_05360 [Vibrio porteresiae DSM 19223]